MGKYGANTYDIGIYVYPIWTPVSLPEPIPPPVEIWIPIPEYNIGIPPDPSPFIVPAKPVI